RPEALQGGRNGEVPIPRDIDAVLETPRDVLGGSLGDGRGGILGKLEVLPELVEEVDAVHAPGEVVPQAEGVAHLVEHHPDVDLLAKDLEDLLTAHVGTLGASELDGQADDVAVDHLLFEHAVVLALQHLDLAPLLDLLGGDEIERSEEHTSELQSRENLV